MNQKTFCIKTYDYGVHKVNSPLVKWKVKGELRGKLMETAAAHSQFFPTYIYESVRHRSKTTVDQLQIKKHCT